MWLHFVLVGVLALAAPGFSQLTGQIDPVINNQAGYVMTRDPTYLIIAPRKIRPSQIVQVFTTILRLEYSHINVVVSIVMNNVEYAGTMMVFDRPASRLMQLEMPSNAGPGQYRLRVEGVLNTESSGYVFRNETDLMFDPKQASVFILLSKPIYRQGQTVHYRIVPVLPNLMPKYGSMTIKVRDSGGMVVRRWLGQQTNAGGLVSESFRLSDQPRYGNWSIEVEAYGITYTKWFRVEEFWEPRFDINVTIPPYVMADMDGIFGSIMANQTSGRPVKGNATLLLTMVPPGQVFNHNGNNNHLPVIYKFFDYFDSLVNFVFTREEIYRAAQGRMFDGNNLDNYEFMLNVSVYDWMSVINRTGWASSYCFSAQIRLQWIGDPIRTFKPDSIIEATVAVMRYDGTPVTFTDKFVTVRQSHKAVGGTLAERQPINKTPVNGFATFLVYGEKEDQLIVLTAVFDSIESTRTELRAFRYYSPTDSFIQVTTSTAVPMVNKYMIFHIRTSNYVPSVYYQIVAGGNIIIGDELEMISTQKSFAIALSREMIPNARIVVYYVRQPIHEIVVDTLNFFVNGTRLNPVQCKVNLGKDFSRDTIEIKAYADPGSYSAFQATPYDLYIRGMDAGLNENRLIDDLSTYDYPANGSYKHMWRLSETEYQYRFYPANGYGVDANTTFLTSGLLVLTDALVSRVLSTCDIKTQLPCFDGTCFEIEKRCDRTLDCQDGADEQGCIFEEKRYSKVFDIDRISRVMRNYDDSSWMWQEYFIKPDSQVQFRVTPPKYPINWVMTGLSISRDLGLGVTQNPTMYTSTRYMYIQVEAPETAVRGEQIGFRVTTFNYWYNDDFIEVLITLHGAPNQEFVIVEAFGIVSSYRPKTAAGDLQVIVFLEPGESKDIYLPILPTIVMGEIEVSISAYSFLGRDTVTRKVKIQPDGITNYYHTPYLIDLITQGSTIIPDLDVNVPLLFTIPEQREHVYVPGSGVCDLNLFGDVVTSGFFEDFLNAENILRLPYGSAEGNMFNFAYMLWTLNFMKSSQQLDDATLRAALDQMNVVMQRQLSYMNLDGSFSMFRDHYEPSLWMTAFAAKTFHGAHFGEWERDLFIPLELINKMVSFICSRQNMTTGAFDAGNETEPVYDRKMSDLNDKIPYANSMALTAYVLIALYETTELSGDALNCVQPARQNAASYLSKNLHTIGGGPDKDGFNVFQMAIVAYALSMSSEKSRAAYDILWIHRREKEENVYFADKDVPGNPFNITQTVRYLKPRVDLENDAYATQTTAYALMAHLNHDQPKFSRDSMMSWLQSMHNHVDGFTSTQDTLVAIEALYKFSQVDPNRNVFNMAVSLESTATANWRQIFTLLKTNYTDLRVASLPKVYGAVKVMAQGAGRAMMQMATRVNVEWPWQLKPPAAKCFSLDYNSHWSGRNFSIMEVDLCASWTLTDRRLRTGLAVMEIELPSGFVAMNNTLRDLVQSKIVPNLRRAEFYNRKVVFYFSYLDQSRTCVYFRADRWYPIANGTLAYRMRVFDYYEPGLHNTTMYTAYHLFNLNICFACGSYQCPYCPDFNVANAIKATITTILCVAFGVLFRRYINRT